MENISEDEKRDIMKKNENWYKFIDAVEDDGLSVNEAIDLLINEGVSAKEISEIIKKYEKWF